MKYILSFISIAFSLLFLEIFVRVFIDDGMNYEIEMMKYANQLKKISINKKIGIEHRINVTGKYMGTQVNLDENGFRYSKKNKKDKDKEKILMLGDSMTFGWGANNTFSSLLNDKINNYEVLNAGIGNTNTIMQINNFFENFSDKFSYKIIVLNFFINDFENIIIKPPNFFQKYSLFYTFINNKINTILIKFKIKNNWNNFYSESYLNNSIKLETLSMIKKLNNFCKKNNIKFVIHNIPELRNLKNYKFLKETKIINDFASLNNIQYINSFEMLKNYPEETLWVTELDPHANDRAHEIMANHLYENLKIN